MIPIRKPLDHADVKRLFPQLLEQSLDAETRGRVQGHLDGCEECFFALATEIDLAVEQGLLPKIDVPPMPAIPGLK